MLKYFHDKIAENPSFQYALQMDREEQITNIFCLSLRSFSPYVLCFLNVGRIEYMGRRKIWTASVIICYVSSDGSRMSQERRNNFGRLSYVERSTLEDPHWPLVRFRTSGLRYRGSEKHTRP